MGRGAEVIVGKLGARIGAQQALCVQLCGGNCMTLRSAFRDLLLHMLMWVGMAVKAQGCARQQVNWLWVPCDCCPAALQRDLKPQNLLLSDNTPQAVLKIADFGFARNLEPQNLAETMCGSPLYMAPEILQVSTQCGDDRTVVTEADAPLHHTDVEPAFTLVALPAMLTLICMSISWFQSSAGAIMPPRPACYTCSLRAQVPVSSCDAAVACSTC